LEARHGCDKRLRMDLFPVATATRVREERKMEQVCRCFDMDCVDLDHESCWRGEAGTMPCCGLRVEFERERGICPFLWVKGIR
jgi:hypothetical protein